MMKSCRCGFYSRYMINSKFNCGLVFIYLWSNGLQDKVHGIAFAYHKLLFAKTLHMSTFPDFLKGKIDPVYHFIYLKHLKTIELI